jgi:hypothetical protein
MVDQTRVIPARNTSEELKNYSETAMLGVQLRWRFRNPTLGGSKSIVLRSFRRDGRSRSSADLFATASNFFRFSEVGTPAALRETLPRWLIVGKEVLSANVAAKTAFVVQVGFLRHVTKSDASLKRRSTLVYAHPCWKNLVFCLRAPG